MKTVWSELTTCRMLALTKAALHDTTPDDTLFINTDETNWSEVFELSAAQGVMVLSFLGAMRLPKELHPPLKLKLRWIAGVEAVEKKYQHSVEVAKDLSARFRENNIRMMVFKGLSLARLYPVPYSREFGDMDIFLCGKSAEGDALLEKLIGERYLTSKKHVNFSYRGILIENHHHFINQGKDRKLHRSEDLEKRLMNFLMEADKSEETNENESFGSNDTVLFPPPDFDALFVTLHLLVHLANRIVLRHLCDLTKLFTVYNGKIDMSQYRHALSETGLLNLADAIISLSVRYLDLNPEFAPPYQSDVMLENRLWNDMINPKVPTLSKEKHNVFAVLIFKIRMLQSNYWKYKMIFPGQFWKRIINSILFRIKNPKIFWQ